MEELPSSVPQPGPPGPPNYLYPAFWAGFCSGILSGVPVLSQGFCLWISGAGTLAVYFFRLINGYPLTKASEGARLGLFAGFWGGLVATIVAFSSNVLILRGVHNVAAAFRDWAQTLPSTTNEQKEAVKFVMTTEGMVAMFVVGSIVIAVIYMLGSMAGGAIAVRAFNRPDVGSGPGNDRA